jgi:aryl-alcohol dehydrogenase-like predicted oxidoreductase
MYNELSFFGEGCMVDDNPHYHKIFDDVQIGIGTWAWGDKLYWGFGKGYDENDLNEVFQTCVNKGVNFFDTAEVYGQGKSESLLGNFIQANERKVMVATKFMPLPWRFNRKSLLKAIRASLKRLKLNSVELYQIHMPLPPVRIETWMEAMAEAKQNNLIEAVGVSNYNHQQMERAFESLAKQGILLASNQVEYSLINRTIEKNGLLKSCSDRGIKCIAYSPMGMGILSGKYSSENPVQGMRASRFSRQDLLKLRPLIDLLKKIGSDHGGKTAAQIAINWVRSKGALPIPGAKNISQAEQNIDILDWQLSEEEVSRLDEISYRVQKET